jgi:hypothetical protein
MVCVSINETGYIANDKRSEETNDSDTPSRKNE